MAPQLFMYTNSDRKCLWIKFKSEYNVQVQAGCEHVDTINSIKTKPISTTFESCPVGIIMDK